jgi:D-alanine-D-alanine ligase
LKTTILYDAGADDWTAADVRAVLESCEAVADVLTAAGHAVDLVPVRADRAWMDALGETDLVFNLCEGIEGVSRLEYQVTAAVELLGLPVTGTSARTTALCHRKPALNALLLGHGLPVPAWQEIQDADALDAAELPAIVKPAEEDASVGIDQGSVVTTRAALVARAEAMCRRFGRVIVQQYIPGREFNIGFVGDDTLPISEIDFGAMPDGAWPIVSFAAKWEPGSAEDRGTQPVCPARVDATLADRLVDVARRAWRAVDGHGYGRVDIRVDDQGRPWILEVNPCPDASPDAGLANMARAHGWSYDDLVLRIVGAARSVQQPLPVAVGSDG